ncbi:carboxypeptidase D-like isoform X2 [Homalodisca vitripennis]|uniref:carboxypeptidase D-like isoform X2 n=1 Tax=Homalodisca vitripennis TaxID=197043 RepID=UPI001EEC98CD|nr:carboxypeptidase D-like isoform X2 [Homalodisca vitripennis]
MMKLWGMLLVFIAFNYADDSLLSLDRYHTHEEMISFLKNFTKMHSNLTRLYSIGESFEGRELLVLRISGGDDLLLRPNLKLVGNIHGNEAVGREVLLHFIEYLVTEYNKGNKRVRRLLDYAHVHILPSMNPDGFACALRDNVVDDHDSEPGIHPPGHCMARDGRANSLGKDLNRNFPDYFRKVRPELQNETLAVMRWLDDFPFVLSAALHGGSLVANYPFDNSKYDSSLSKEPNLTEDDDVFKHLALVYARKHPTMHKGKACPNNYAKDTFPKGIVNGAEWYPLTGSMQDYNYVVHGCMEITLEISCCKFPEPEELQSSWDQNREPLLAFLEESRRGVRGFVMDENGIPLPNATIRILGRETFPFYSTPKGEFWRILLAGTYLFQVEAQGFDNRRITVIVNEPKQAEWEWPRVVNVTLYRTGSTRTTQVITSSETSTESMRNIRGSASSWESESLQHANKSSAVTLMFSKLLLVLVVLFSL